MGKGEGFLDRWIRNTELPGEVLPGQSVLELIGENRVLIEGHRGVIHYSREQIGVKMRFGALMVCGCGLELHHMTRDQLVIRGRIDGISVQRRG